MKPAKQGKLHRQPTRSPLLPTLHPNAASPDHLCPYGHWIFFLVAVLSALLAAAPLWGPGIINTRGGGDSPFLIQRTLSMAENLADGAIPPRWMAHAAYDLGYPFFNHYAALPYYLSGGLTALGMNVISAIQVTQTLGFVLAALAMARWVRRIYHQPAAQALAVIAYTFAPFHLVNVYVRGDSLSEFYAFVWYPLILSALDNAIELPSRRRVLSAALAYGGLILTHNVSALIFSPFALLWGLIAVWRHSHHRKPDNGVASARAMVRRLPALILPFILGVLLTAWFWLPAIVETRYGQMGDAFTAGYFHYSNHFRGLDLVQPTWAFDYSVATDLADVSPFSMGLTQAGITVIGLCLGTIALLRKVNDAEQRLLASAVLTCTILATLMITPLSSLLWQHLPLLEITQFPWRFLSVQSLFAAAVTGYIGVPSLRKAQSPATRRPRRASLWSAGLSAVAALSLMLAGLAHLRPDRLLIGADDVTRGNLLLYESFTGNIGTTIRYEYLPQDVVPRLYVSEAVIDGRGHPIAEGDHTVESELVDRRSNHQTWKIDLPDGGTNVAFPLNWWPGWAAHLDGQATDTFPQLGSGRATVAVPPGAHTVTFSLRPTPLQTLAGAISVVAGLAAAGVAIIAPVRHAQRPAGSRRSPGAEWAPRLAAGVILGLATLSGPLLGRRTPPGTATFFDFEQMPYPHQGPIAFSGPTVADGPTLQTATLSAESVHPGQQLLATMRWSALPSEPLTVTLDLVSPAEPRHGVSYTLASAVAPVTELTTAEIDLPATLTRGLYLVRMTVENRLAPLKATTAQGRTMGDLFVGAMRVTQGPPLPTDAPQLATYRDLVLHSLEAVQDSPTDLALTMRWSTTGTPRNWRLSLRLLDPRGSQVVQQDHQPGYGYLPTTLWQPGEQIFDRAHIPLPEGLAPGTYTLRLITYLQGTGERGGEVDLPVRITDPTLWDIRDACCEQTRKGATIVCRTREMALLTTSLPERIAEGDDLHLTAEWNALLAPTVDLSARWDIVDPDGQTVAHTQGPLAAASRTSEWPRFTWVLSPVTVDLPSRIAAGEYKMHLTLTAGAEQVARCGEVGAFTIASRPRHFDVPRLPVVQTASYADTLRLLGYDVDIDGRRGILDITLWWQAISAPAQDYKRFVHLYEPDTETIVAQDDAMPRNWTYPTSWWLPGEVVSETLSLSLEDAKADHYRIAVGWYDPDTLARLPVRIADDAGAPADRVTLSQPVVLRTRRWWQRR